MMIKMDSYKGTHIELGKYESLPTMEEAIHSILKDCKGMEHRISRRRLRAVLQVYFNKVRDRDMRLIIAKLRKEGAPICSMATKGGGYWYAASPDELDQFIIREMKSRIKDIRETVDALQRTGQEMWGDLVTTRMF